jgi:D-alanyl-D-alanine carboxypeptidase
MSLNNSFSTVLKKMRLYGSILLFFVLGVIIVGYGFLYAGQVLIERQQQALLSLQRDAFFSSLDTTLGLRLDEQDNVVQANSVSVYDLTSHRMVYQKNGDEVHGIASLTKLMTALVASDADPVTPITMDTRAVATVGDSLVRVGDTWSLREVLPFMLVVSSNDIAVALGEILPNILGDMNARAEVLGMNATQFLNTTGLDEGDQLGAVSTTHDIIKLLTYLYETRPLFLGALGSVGATLTRSDGSIIHGEHTHVAIDDIPGMWISKTGYTDTAGGAIAMIVRPHPETAFAIVLLNSTFEGRFEDARTIAESIATTVYAYEPLMASFVQ